MNPSSVHELEKAFQKRFLFLRKRDQWIRFSSSLILSIVIVTGFLLVSLLLEMLFHCSSSVRSFWLVLFKGIGFCGLFFIFFRLWNVFIFRKQIPDDETLALRLGNVYPKVRDRLINGLQVHRQIGRSDGGTSPSMASKAFADILQEILPLDIRPVVSKYSLRSLVRLLVLETGLALLILALFSDELVHARERIFDPSRSDGRGAFSPLTLLPGDKWVIQGEDVEISVRTEIPQISRIILCFQEEGESKMWERDLRPPFRYRFAGVRKDFVYYARWKKIQTPKYRIRVVQRPTVRVLEVRTIPPAYTRMASEVLEPNTGQLDVLRGTRIELSIQANKPVVRAVLRFDKGTEIPMGSNDRSVSGSFLAMHEDRYWVDLEDGLGLHNGDPIAYPVRVVDDRVPNVQLLSPGKDVDLDESMVLPLVIEEEDDFGISQTRLLYRVSGSTIENSEDTVFSTIPLPMGSDQPTRCRIDTLWDLAGMDLLPEHVVQYAVEVVDNDRISGPKTGRTRFFSARFPSMIEIFREVEKEQTEHIGDLLSLYEESKDVRQELEKISEEIKTASELSWMERQNLEDTIQKTENIQNEIRNTAEKIGDMVVTMEEKNMLQPQVAEKYNELQKLFQELASPALRDMMEKLQEAIRRIDEDEIQKALDRLKNAEDQLIQSLDRTIALLKRLQVEQKVEELQKRMEDLFERQTSINERMGETRPDDLAREENLIRRDTDSFREELDNTVQKMEALSDMPVEPMEKIGESMDRNGLMDRLGNIEKNIQGGRIQEAREGGIAAGQEMASIKEQLDRIRDMIQGQEKERISRALGEYSSRLLELSQNQETLGENIRNNRISRDSAMEKQLSLLDGFSQVVDSMVQLSKATFFITPGIGNAMGETRSKMQQAIAAFSAQSNTGTDSPQKGAVSGLNRTVVEIQKALEKMGGSGSGLGSDEWMMQMEQMAQQQSGINRQTSDWLERGGLSLEEQAALSRIASGQEGLRRSLEELSGRMQSFSQLAGNVDKIVQDMEDVVRDLENKNVNPRVLEKQQRILSRLLDAQRSLRKEEFDKRRESKTGIDVARRSPNWNGPPAISEGDSIRDDILQTSQKGFTKEFQEWIKRYFLALDRETRK